MVIVMKISVAMTCYNGSQYLIEQLDSLRVQTCLIDEVCIIDDKSTDNSFEMIKDYINLYGLTGWSILSNEENLGWIRNFHKAISMTSGDIVFFCDQDDIWYDNKIQEMIKIMTEFKKIKVLACRLKLIDGLGKRLPDMHSGFPFDSNNTNAVTKNAMNRKFLYTISPGCTLGVKRDLITKLYGINGADRLPHDALFWKIGTVLDCAYTYDKPLMDYRIHSNNASNPAATVNNTIKSRELRIKEIEVYKSTMSYIKDIVKELNIKEEYNEILKSTSDHLDKREKWLRKEKSKNILIYFLEEHKFYRNTKMFLGDLLAKK